MPAPIEFEMLRMVPPTLPYDRPRSFDEATELTPSSQRGHFTAQLRADWAYGPRVNGGYLVSILLQAGKITSTPDSRGNSHVDPSSWTTNFLNTASVGVAEIETCTLRASVDSTFIRAELWQKGFLCVETTMMMSDVGAAQKHPLNLPPSAMPNLPVDQFKNKAEKITESALQRDGWQTRNMAENQPFFQTKPDVKFYLPPGSDLWNSRHIVHPILGPNYRDMWFTFGTEHPLTPASLPVAIDSFLPLHLNYPSGVEYFIATQSISCELRKTCLEHGWEWLFGRAELRECSGGKYIVDITILDEGGQIVALARLVQKVISVMSLLGAQSKSKRSKPSL